MKTSIDREIDRDKRKEINMICREKYTVRGEKKVRDNERERVKGVESVDGNTKWWHKWSPFDITQKDYQVYHDITRK